MPKKSLVAMVKQALTKVGEKKFQNLQDSFFSNSGILNADLVQLIPPITNGVLENQRIGHTITPRALIVKVRLAYDRSTYSPSIAVVPFQARMFIFSMKNSKSNADILTVPVGSLLKLNGTNTAYTGTIGNNQLPANRDLFNIHHDKLVSFTGQGGISPPSAYTQAEKSHDFVFRVPLPKTLKYDDVINGNLFPTNAAVYFAVGYEYVDGSVPDVVNTNMRTTITYGLTYTDA